MQIPNEKTLTDKQKEQLVTFICFKFQKNNILNLRKVVGDEGLLKLLNHFAGTYTRFPTISNVVLLANQLHLVFLYDELKAAANGNNPVAWQEAEQRFIKFAETKFSYNYQDAKPAVKKIKKELDLANNWHIGITSWESRNTPSDGK